VISDFDKFDVTLPMSSPARVHALIHRAKQFFDGVRRTVVISRAAAVSRGFPKVELSRASSANHFQSPHNSLQAAASRP